MERNKNSRVLMSLFEQFCGTLLSSVDNTSTLRNEDLSMTRCNIILLQNECLGPYTEKKLCGVAASPPEVSNIFFFCYLSYQMGNSEVSFGHLARLQVLPPHAPGFPRRRWRRSRRRRQVQLRELHDLVNTSKKMVARAVCSCTERP